eukprot:519382_1
MLFMRALNNIKNNNNCTILNESVLTDIAAYPALKDNDNLLFYNSQPQKEGVVSEPETETNDNNKNNNNNNILNNIQIESENELIIACKQNTIKLNELSTQIGAFKRKLSTSNELNNEEISAISTKLNECEIKQKCYMFRDETLKKIINNMTKSKKTLSKSKNPKALKQIL